MKDKEYTEKQVWSIIEELDWSATICDHEPCYGQITIQVALEEDGDYFGEFIQWQDGLYTFVFYTKESN